MKLLFPATPHISTPPKTITSVVLLPAVSEKNTRVLTFLCTIPAINRDFSILSLSSLRRLTKVLGAFSRLCWSLVSYDAGLFFCCTAAWGLCMTWRAWLCRGLSACFTVTLLGSDGSNADVQSDGTKSGES